MSDTDSTAPEDRWAAKGLSLARQALGEGRVLIEGWTPEHLGQVIGNELRQAHEDGKSEGAEDTMHELTTTGRIR